MKRIILLLAGVMILSVSQSSADSVIDWNATGITVMLKVPTLARNPLLDLTYMHIAIYDAVNAIDGRYSVFAVTPPNAAPWASKEAAAAAAAHRVLLTFYASQQPYLDSVYAAALALLPNDSTKTRGIAIGDTVATRYLASRAGDGRDAIVTYAWLPAAPGVYEPTPPGGAQYQPLNIWLPQVRPFAATSASQFRAPGPAPLTSDVYARDFNEVKRYGSRDSSSTTAQQRELARFYTENPNVYISRNIRLFAISQHMSIAYNARLFAQLYVSINDALITGFESKYYYNAWRPSTAIRGADTDSNPLTVRDSIWVAFVATPTHPEYPAAHGCATGAFARTLEKFFGRAVFPVTLTSTVTGTQHSFTNLNDIVTDVVNGRVYGGMHFRSSVEDGAAIGQNVADWVARQKFTPLSSPIPLTGLQMWLRADAGVDAPLGTVSRWHDQSGNGNDAVQTDASRQPLVVANALNGKPALRFDGFNDKLGFIGTAPMTQFSLFLVINNHQGSSAGNGDGAVITFGASGDFNHQWFTLMRFTNSPDSIAIGPRDDGYVNAFSKNVAAYDQWRNLSIITTGTTFSTTLQSDGIAARMSLDGFDQANSVPLGDATGSGGGIGGADGVPAGLLVAKCDVAEVIVYNVSLSETDRKSVEAYLSTKYGSAFPTGVVGQKTGNLPAQFALEQNYPNPFNPTTVVRYQLPAASNVRLVVFDLLGREVSSLVNEREGPGSYEVKFDGAGLSSGVYFYRLTADNLVQTRKLMLLR